MPTLFLSTPFTSWNQFGRATGLAAWGTDPEGHTSGEYFLLVGSEEVQHGVINGNIGGADVLRAILGKLNGRWLQQYPMESGVPALSEIHPSELFVEEQGVDSIASALKAIARKNPAIHQELAQHW